MLNIQKNIILAPYTTYRIGGPARFFVVVKNKEELIEAINWAKEEKVRYFILGGGSNILFADNGYDGLVIKMEMTEIKINKNIINCQSGVSLSQLAIKSIESGLTGLEWAIGIPGTVGGAVCGNAGAHDGCMSDTVVEVEAFDEKNVKNINNNNLKFTYRGSILKKINLVVLSVTLILDFGKTEESKKKSKEFLTKRNNSQPKGFSAGSVFKNPEDYSAGRLIDECGLKGKQIGKAKISEKHANFIINTGGATAKDVLSLMELTKKEVYKKFKIELESENVLVL